MAAGDYKSNLTELLRAGGYTGDNEQQEYSANLAETSKEVQRRVRALKQYQLEGIKLETEFYARVHELEAEFQPRFDVLGEKRKKVVTGEYEPKEEECQLPLVHGLEPEELQKLENNAPVEGGTPSKGVPCFWYHVLNNIAQTSDIIYEYDVPILKYLMDITTEVHKDPTGFSLYFHFAENPYFTNNVLRKYYELKLFADNDEPFQYDGPSIVKSEGTKIDWKEDKNVTQKVVKKKQKKGSGAGRFITKTVPNKSFFSLFDPATRTLSNNDDENDEDVRLDFEVGQVIRDQVIPRAVLFFTGEAADDEDDFFDEEDAADEDASDANEEDD